MTFNGRRRRTCRFTPSQPLWLYQEEEEEKEEEQEEEEEREWEEEEEEVGHSP